MNELMNDTLTPGNIRPMPHIYNVNPEWPASYIVWDIETTGLDPLSCHILEIGLLEVENGEVVGQYEWLLDHGVPISEESQAIHGITKEMIQERGRDPKQCFEEFLNKLQPGTVPHITHNGYRFDIPWVIHHAMELLDLEAEARTSLKMHLEHTMIDTAVMMKGALLEMRPRFNETTVEYAKRVMDIRAKGVKYNVTACCEKLGIDAAAVQTHRAGGDIILTNQIYQHLVNPVLKADV